MKEVCAVRRVGGPVRQEGLGLSSFLPKTQRSQKSLVRLTTSRFLSSCASIMDGKPKDILSTLPLAPGGVYSVKWENRIKWGKQVDLESVAYTPPFPVNPANPRCFLVRPQPHTHRWQEYAPPSVG
jgi:hypothetical protein